MSSGCPGQIRCREEPQTQGPTDPVGCMFVCPADRVQQFLAPSKDATKAHQVQVLKAEVPDVVVFKPFTLQGEAQGLECPPLWVTMPRVGFMVTISCLSPSSLL